MLGRVLVLFLLGLAIRPLYISVCIDRTQSTILVCYILEPPYQKRIFASIIEEGNLAGQFLYNKIAVLSSGG
nr:MAG TPA: hypothetical protein [Caudoviricetes sp.]